MAVVLGFAPERLTVKLSRHGDFVAALIYDDGDPLTPNEWPAGAVIELRFYATPTSETPAVTWPATIADDRAEWHIDKTDVDTDVLDPGNDTARLFYSEGGTELEWAIGVTKDVN